MNYSEVKELLQAGFTADEIRQMLSVNPQDDNPQNPQENPQVEEPEYQAEVKQPDPVPVNDQRFDQLNTTMEKLIRTIQSANLNNSSFDSVKETDINTEVDKIMASIIRPERKEGGNNQ